MEVHDPTLFEGLIFAVSQDTVALLRGLNIVNIIELCGGKVVEYESNQRGSATHVLARHLKQECCVWGQEERKTLVTPFWVFESSEENRLLPLEDPLYTPFPSEGIPAAADCQVTLTGFKGPIRSHLLELLACTGASVMRQMNPMTVTHVVTSDVNEDTEKLNRARQHQSRRPGRISVINCLWIYNSLRFWEVQPPEHYNGNPDPKEDPARGQLASKSLPSQLAEVPNSEDDDAEVPVGKLHTAIEPTEAEISPHLGSPPADHACLVVPSSTAVTSEARPLAEAAAPSTGPRLDNQGALDSNRSAPSSVWRTRNRTGHATPSTPATMADPSPAAKENTAPRTVATSIAGQPKGGKAGSARACDSMEPQRINSGNASESQVPEYQVAAANATTASLIAQLAPGFPNSDPQPQVARVSLLQSVGNKTTCQRREAILEHKEDMLAHHEEESSEDVNRESGNVGACTADGEAAMTDAPSRQHVELRKRARQHKSTPAIAQDAEPELQPSKKRKLLSKADSAALGRAPRATADAKLQEAPAVRQMVPAGKAKSRTKSKCGAAEAREVQQDMEHAGPSTGRACTPSPNAQRRDVQKRPFVALSGLHTKEILKFSPMLESLGVSHTDGLEDHHVWNSRTTHWVAPKLNRTAKALSAMAAGAWLLSTSFITASAAARSLVDPETHELESGCELVADGAPLHWRMRAKSLGHGAFHGLRVLVYGTFKTNVKPTRKDITSILSAGGATLLSLQEAIAHGVDLTIMPEGTSKIQVKELLKAKVTCARPQYIVEWIARPDDSLAEHLLHGTAESAKLADMAQERSKCLGAEEQSCSF